MPSLTFAEFEPLHRMAVRMARGLCRRLRLPAHDAEDFAQNLLTDLLARLPSFNPGQGQLGAFALTCFRHHAALLAHRTQRYRTLHHPTSLDDPLPEGSATVGALLSEADGYGAWMGQQTDAFADVNRRIDLERVADVLTEEDAPLCAALARGDVDPARHAGLSRTTAFRRVREMRLRLCAAGIAPAA
ncbi:sigma factor [Rubritepida flocculans]|uniref:sigma factor n=1 Tax=Rubritepida flocculans TaxID=182403 RepID=UPI000404EC66|nr:sigma factor [Rubritepida flocculans]